MRFLSNLKRLAWVLAAFLAATTSEAGTMRRYYIAAEEVEWNYLPTNLNCLGPDEEIHFGEPEVSPPLFDCPNNVTGSEEGGGGHNHGMSMDMALMSSMHLHGDDHDNHDAVIDSHGGHSTAMWVTRSARSLGRKALKAQYVEYTDASFTVRKERSSEWQHLGLLGPIMRAEVGDTIRVLFRNKLRYPATIHPHGVFYDKENEGANYPDGDLAGDLVEPGASYTYQWGVPERSGPGPMDGSSIMWIYHSHVDEIRDTNAGLVGGIIVTRKGMADEDGKPIDIDREFVVAYTVYDEGSSRYFTENLNIYLNETYYDNNMTRDDLMELMHDEDFTEGNEKHSINGFIFANIPDLTIRKGDRVRWYTMSLGSEEGFHTLHWHGQTLLMEGHRRDVASLLPAETLVADMVADNEGIWLFHCHVNHHIHAGMTAVYKVLPALPPHDPMDEHHEETISAGAWLAVFGFIFVPMACFSALAYQMHRNKLVQSLLPTSMKADEDALLSRGRSSSNVDAIVLSPSSRRSVSASASTTASSSPSSASRSQHRGPTIVIAPPIQQSNAPRSIDPLPFPSIPAPTASPPPPPLSPSSLSVSSSSSSSSAADHASPHISPLAPLIVSPPHPQALPATAAASGAASPLLPPSDMLAGP